jgi:GntR family transcriptional regulator
MAIDQDDPIELHPGLPLHAQISRWFREQIERGEINPGEQLPSENELSARFSVSRPTVRRALQTLETENLIYRRPGLGSFVADRRVSQGLVRLTDFAQDMERAGLEATSRILHQARESASGALASQLGLAEGAQLFRLDRLRLGDGTPIALDRTWLPPFYAQLLEGHDLTQDTIYRILEKEYGIPILSGRYRLTAEAADPELAEDLGIPCGDALLLIERISRTAGGRPVYVQRRYYRSDRVAYELEVARDPDGSRDSDGDDPAMPLREFEAVFRSPAD